jgi:leucyl/phenylalanyl-tRNA--protein transferase
VERARGRAVYPAPRSPPARAKFLRLGRGDGSTLPDAPHQDEPEADDESRCADGEERGPAGCRVHEAADQQQADRLQSAECRLGDVPSPVEPPASAHTFPDPATADERGRVFAGADLEPGTLLLAYRSGLFPMRSSIGELTWWSPEIRGILPLRALRVSSSLHRSINHFTTTVDTAFETVVERCAERAPGEYVWITPEIRDAYSSLHRLGWAHSVEAWTIAADGGPDELVGGLYGIAIGGYFAGESMFHRRPDASKVALVRLVKLLAGGGDDADDRLIDVQWLTPHFASLGAIEVSRTEYAARLERALALPLPPAFAESDSAVPSGGAPDGDQASDRSGAVGPTPPAVGFPGGRS